MEHSATGPGPPKVRVLVADDEEVIADTLATILELAGYEICAVYNGEAAIALLDLFQPDLLITDVTMPGITGIEVAYAARASLPRCKILLFTGHAGLHELLRVAGAADLPFDVVTKPILPRELLARLRTTLCSDQPTLLIPIELDDPQVH